MELLQFCFVGGWKDEELHHHWELNKTLGYLGHVTDGTLHCYQMTVK